MVSPLSLECVDLMYANNFSGRLLKVILGILKLQDAVCCWSNGITHCVENCINERRDHVQIMLFHLILLLSLATNGEV